MQNSIESLVNTIDVDNVTVEINKILIIQTAYIGDVILATPLIEKCRQLFIHAKIDFLTIPASENILEKNPLISELIIFDKRKEDKGIRGLLRLAGLLSQKHYDLCLTPHRSMRSAYLTRRSAAPIRIGFDLTAWQSCFTSIVRYQKDRHEIERNLSLLEPLGYHCDLTQPVIYATEKDEQYVSSRLNQLGLNREKPIFCVAPGSIWATKRWPEESYTFFCQQLEKKDIQPVLIGGQADAELCSRITEKCSAVKSTAGFFSLRQSYILLKNSLGLLSNDSAPLHLGMAAGISVFAIFGATIPAFGFAPFGDRAVIFEVKDLSCRPCSIHGGNKCPLKTFECMEAISATSVFSQVIDKIM